MTTKWKVGDWCLYEHGIFQIKEMEGDLVVDLSDGSFSHGSRDFTPWMYPLTLEGKACADYFEHRYNELHREFGHKVNNWPDINRHVNSIFNKCMDYLQAGDNAKMQAEYDSADKFFREFSDKVRDIGQIEVDGVRLVR